MRNEIIVLGSGGHAKVVIATARALGYRVSAAYDDDAAKHGGEILGVPVLGAIADAEPSPHAAVVAIGSNRARQAVAERISLHWISLVHPSAHVHESVKLGDGTVIFAGAVIQPDSVIGQHGVINTAASVDHDCRLGSFVHVGPGAHLAGEVIVGDGTLFGIGSCAIPQMVIGTWSVVGAGASVVSSVPDHAVVVGSPAASKSRT